MGLGEYLEREAKRPWTWGSADCCTFAADWVLSETGHDPMAQWRDYSTEADAELLIAEAGGLEAMWSEGLAPVMSRVDTPSLGSVGLILVPDQFGEIIQIGAIFSGRRWVFRTPRGIAGASIDPASVVAIWAR